MPLFGESLYIGGTLPRPDAVRRSSTTTVWICHLPGLRSETWGTQTVMSVISCLAMEG